jgi:hypothetical protein
MSLLDAPVATFSKSELRKPEVVKAAEHGLVEIRTGGPTDPLVLVPGAAVQVIRDLRRAAEEFLRVFAELRRERPSRIVLGDVAFVADWDPEDRDRFLEGYAEALDASLRTESTAPLRAFVSAMDSVARHVESPKVEGRIAPDAHDALAARLRS